MSYLKPQLSFSLNFASFSVSCETTLLYFFSWNFMWFLQKELIKVQNLSCSGKISPNLDYLRLLSLKVCKISARKYRGVMSHDIEEWCKTWRKNNLLFQKFKKFGEFWSKHWKVSKICNLIGPFRAKYIISELKNYKRVIFHDTEESCKIWRKTKLWFRKWHEQFGKFSSEHLKVLKVVLSLDPFAQSRKYMN